MSRPTAGEDVLPKWLRKRWVQQLVGVGVLLALVVFLVVWAVIAAASVSLLRDASGDPAAVVFVSAWLLLWAALPVAVFLAVLVKRRDPRQAFRHEYYGTSDWQCPTPTPSSALQWYGRLFLGCFAVVWCAGLAGLLRQGDVGGFVGMSAFTALCVLVATGSALYRQTITIDPQTLLTLEIHAKVGPFHRKRVYQLRLIRNPRAMREKDSDGDFTGCWLVAFDYGSKRVRFGQNMSQQEAEERVRDLAKHV